MCGIVGFAARHAGNAERDIAAMNDCIKHRGPDDHGVWQMAEPAIVLGHRRLSIVDLTATGHQPMTSHSGKYVIVFNGEIYNHSELRLKIEASGFCKTWRGHSDTETLLTCFEAWGIKETLQQCVGMFAFALADTEKKSLTLARDRAGEKPLYYGWQNGNFLFGSELKSLKHHPSFENNTNWEALAHFLKLNYIPVPYTAFKNIHKLPAGCCLELTKEDIEKTILPQPTSYWSLEESAVAGQANPFKGSFNDALNELEFLLRRSVQLQLMADVPVGAFLSGGIDSSIVVAMMKAVSVADVITFSIGMPDPKANEAEFAKQVANHLGTQHIEHIISPQEALALIPALQGIWDEPFADSSQIPTILVSKLARERVTVALSGDGGDEFFLGYGKYRFYDKHWRTRGMRHMGIGALQKAAGVFGDGNVKLSGIKRKLTTLNGLWKQPDGRSMYNYWTNNYRTSAQPLKKDLAVAIGAGLPELDSVAETVALCDAKYYMPDDVLVKVDRASMYNSLETRAPLLDHRIMEFAYTLPVEFKMGKTADKHILRELLYKYVPRELVDRPKMGFSIPLASWLRKELRAWAEELIHSIPDHSEMLD